MKLNFGWRRVTPAGRSLGAPLTFSEQPPNRAAARAVQRTAALLFQAPHSFTDYFEVPAGVVDSHLQFAPPKIGLQTRPHAKQTSKSGQNRKAHFYLSGVRCNYTCPLAALRR